MTGVYGIIRILMPIAPEWGLRTVAILSLITAVYAAGMALVQHETRRFYCFLFLSQSSLVLVGLETVTPLGLTGALCVWASVSISMLGFGLTLRSIESRISRLSLDSYHGLYSHIPSLAALFLVTGLSSTGFPGTLGFVGSELLIDSVIGIFPVGGVMVVVAAALNSIAVLFCYFRLFTGTQRHASVSLEARWVEKVAVLVLIAILVGGGLWPHPGVISRYQAARAIMTGTGEAPAQQREILLPADAKSNE